MHSAFEDVVIRRALRVPMPDEPAGDGSVAVRQFDAVLMSAGFKLSTDLFDGLAGLSEGTVIDTAVRVLAAVRRMVGDHVEHNVYFRDFPRNVPDTVEFWVELLVEALAHPVAAAQVGEDLSQGRLNLLALPRYGRYQHGYAEMLAAHEEFVAAAADRVTVLHRGDSLAVEASRLYLRLAGSPSALSDEDRDALRALARGCVGDAEQPVSIPVRENRAIVNGARLACGADLLVDTVTDVLRLACELCGGDETLVEPTRFAGLPRRTRRALLATLDQVVGADSAKLGDVRRHTEQWKRLGERLHPHEYPQWPHAARVFAVARGEEAVPSVAARVEMLLARGDVVAATALLSSAPGQLLRAMDRLLRLSPPGQRDRVVEAVEAAVPHVAGSVLVSTRNFLVDRRTAPERWRLFVNRRGRAWAAVDTRPVLELALLERLSTIVDDELRRRLRPHTRVAVEPDMRSIALPATQKATGGGFGVLPRGSVSRIDGVGLRFFTYWKQREKRTDFDLSALMLDERFSNPQWLSFTNLSMAGGTHSGDVVQAADGASEFIDLQLDQVESPVIVPQVLVYSGELFDDVAESFFGFMVRSPDQEGLPFEPRTVRMRSDLRGRGRVAVPLVFLRDDAGWRAHWLHLQLSGRPVFNQVEAQISSATMLVTTLLQREYMTVEHLLGLLPDDAEIVGPSEVGDEPVTYLGLEPPELLPDGSTLFTPANLGELVG